MSIPDAIGAVGRSVQAAAGSFMGGNNSADLNSRNGQDPTRDKDGNPKLTIGSLRQWAAKKNITLSAQDETELMQNNANDAAQRQADLQLDTLQRVAPLNNEIANANTQRNMVVSAQKYNADNVANQLNNLQAARATNAAAISNAINASTSLFK
jgi:hypothetical protein